MYTCTYIYNQSFDQYSYGFQNLMSSFKISCQVGGRGQKFQNYSRYRGYSGKAPGGWGFYSPFSVESSPNKNPTPLGLFASFLVYVRINTRCYLRFFLKKILKIRETLSEFSNAVLNLMVGKRRYFLTLKI